jgi:low affinity Fe/Cu permease
LTSLRHALEWVAHHTGVPVLLVAAVAIVVSWRIFKRSVRLVIEVGVALALLLVATKLGWISW